MNKKLLRKRFNTSKEELAKLGSEFYSEALPLLDGLLETTFYILLEKKHTIKIILQTFYETIEYCDVTKAHSDWFSWIHRIWMREINEFYESRENDIQTKFDFIDYEKIDLPGINNFFSQTDSGSKFSEQNFLVSLRKLPAILRIPLILKELHSLSYEKIAELIDVPFGVIATRIFRARKLLYLFLRGNFDYNLNKRIASTKTFEPIIFESRKCALAVDNELDANQNDELNIKIKSDEKFECELIIQREIKQLFKTLLTNSPDFRRTKKKIEKMAGKRFHKK